MPELNADNAAGYLRQRGLPGAWRAVPLGGGVSNTVLLAQDGERRVVIKQSLGKLRVQEDWFAARERIWRECAALRALAPLLPAGSVPAVVFEDRDNFVYAMEAAPAGARDWKSMLLEGETGDDTARRAGEILAALIRCSRGGEAWLAMFAGQTSFDQLRLDPYYRFTAARHPDLAPTFDAAIAACRRPLALVHGDYSPKNLLVAGSSVLLIDFEVIHIGNPAFDAAFLLNHLLLKAAHRPQWRDRYAACATAFWDALDEPDAGFEPETIRQLGCLHLARADGKSPAEYLDGPTREAVRRRARRLILDPPPSVRSVFETC